MARMSACATDDGVHGKGKVRPRRHVTTTASISAPQTTEAMKAGKTGTKGAVGKQENALRLDMLPHSDLEGGERGDDPPRRFPDEMLFVRVDGRGLDGDGAYTDKVLRINFDSTAGSQEGIRLVRKGKVPVVLRRTPFLTSMVAKWDLNYLVRVQSMNGLAYDLYTSLPIDARSAQK